jgi:Zn-dependent protease
VTVPGATHVATPYIDAVAHGATTSRAFTLFGIPVTFDLSCAVGTVLGAWTVADGVLPVVAPGKTVLAYAAGGAAAALLVAMSVVLHEVAHAAAARRAGVGVRGMTLSLFGGVTELGESPRTARAALRIALAGPVASLALAAIAAAAHVVLVETGAAPLAAAIPAVAAVANLAIASFNAIPALPLDGGHVIAAAIWGLTGRPASGVRVMAALGRLLGLTLLALAIVGSASGDAALALWLALIGLVVWRDAEPLRRAAAA